jgi:uncharacterized protein (DUF58 family)
MKLLKLVRLFSFRDIRNGIVGIAIVLAGLLLAALTLWAHRAGNFALAGWAAAVSLGFVLLILVFVIPPLARSASAEASQMDLPFEFTSGGGIYLGLLVIVGFAAWNTGNNLLFLVLSFLISAFIVSFILGSICLKKLDVKIRFPEMVVAGEPTSLIVSLYNKKFLFPTFSVVAEVRGKERERSSLINELKEILPERLAEKFFRPPLLKHTLEYFPFVPRRDSVESRTDHIFKNRGRFIIKDFELSTRYPFGFFRHRRRLSAEEAEIIVFPKASSLDLGENEIPLDMGKVVSKKKGAGHELMSMRDYRPQDDMRYIDWKATARARQLMVREFSAEGDRRVTICFDPHLQRIEKFDAKSIRERLNDEQKGERNSAEAQKFEKGIAIAAALIERFIAKEAEVRLVLDGEPDDFGSGKDHLNRCLRRLAVQEPIFYDSNFKSPVTEIVNDLMAIRNSSYVFLVSPRPDVINAEDLGERLTVIEY